jgi:hypothetical protein
MKILDILSTNEGAPSSMRMMSVLSLLIGAALAFYGLHKGVDPGNLAWLVAVFVTSGFGGKVLQKRYEKKTTSSDAQKSGLKSDAESTEKP